MEATQEDVAFALEWRKCAPDWDTSTPSELLDGFRHFCSKYVYIKHPERGRILFQLRDAQEETVYAWLTERQTIALKARQIGFSTVVSIYVLWLTFFYRDRTVILISKGEREAAKLLGHAKRAYRGLPEWMKLLGPVDDTWTQQKIEWSNDSLIESLPSRNPARGDTAFLIVVDEIAFLENSDEAYAAIEPAADVGGRIIMLSTANGEGNVFHRIWMESQTGHGDYKGIFFPWWSSDRDQAWYDAKKASLPGWQLAQEYPATAEEAFLKSGRPVFDTDAIAAYEPIPPTPGYLEVRDIPQKKDQTEVVFVEAANGELKLWAEPVENEAYVIGADVAFGLEHGDYSVAQVIHVATGNVVACWHGHVDVSEFGDTILYDLGRYYNWALLGIENNNHGLTTVRAALSAGYPRLYRQRHMGKKKLKPTGTLGWATTSATKPLMIDELGKCLIDQSLGIGDEHTLAELRTFVRDGKGKMGGSPFDDRVMALAIANQMQRFAFAPEYRVKTEGKKPGTWGHLLDKLFAETPDKTPSGPLIGSHAVRR